jgi:hypothetical protein
MVSGRPAPPEILPGVTMIKSPKGSGKTRSLARLTSGAKSLLLIGHRRSLIRQSCHRLGLECYLDQGDDYLEGLPRLGICVDSLARVPSKEKYGVVVLDESEQLLGHFLSDTLDRTGGPGRDRLFVEFRHRVRSAEKVIALDADLSWISFRTLTRMVGEPG